MIRSAPEVELTVLMPCLNESATLASCIRKARSSITRLDLHAEIVIADNGSDDGSQHIAETEGARVVPVDEKGYGSALFHGSEAARDRGTSDTFEDVAAVRRNSIR